MPSSHNSYFSQPSPGRVFLAVVGTWFVVAIFVALAVLLLAAWSSGPTRAMVPKVAQAMQQTLHADFARLEFSHRQSAEALAPALVYQGKSATLLLTHKTRVEEGPLGPHLVLDGLARTPNGRYFEFTYTSMLVIPSESWPHLDVMCTAQLKCRRFSNYGAISEDGAKAWVFESDEFTPESYKAIFNETPPLKRLPA